MSNERIELDDLYTVKDYAAKYPSILTQRVLRYQLRNRDTNGMSRACVKIGKKLLISHTRYQEWLATKQDQPCFVSRGQK